MRAKMKSPKEIPEELWTVKVCGDRWGHRQSVESSYSATRSTTSASTTANNKEPTLAAPFQVLISSLSAPYRGGRQGRGSMYMRIISASPGRR